MRGDVASIDEGEVSWAEGGVEVEVVMANEPGEPARSVPDRCRRVGGVCVVTRVEDAMSRPEDHQVRLWLARRVGGSREERLRYRFDDTGEFQVRPP